MGILPGTVRSVLSGTKYAKVFAKGAGLLLQGSASGAIGIVSPAAPTSYTWTLPDSLPAGDKVIQVSAAGVLTLVDQTPATTSAGSGTEIQYRNGSAFGAVAGSSWNGTKLTLPEQLTIGNIQAWAIADSTWLASRVYVAGTTGTRNLVIGYRAGELLNISASSNTLIGAYSGGAFSGLISGSANTIIGDNTVPGGDVSRTTVVGRDSRANHSDIVLLGVSIVSTAANQFVSGSDTTPISNVYFGKGVTSTTPTAWTLNGTGGSGTNVVGGNLIIAPGPSTGNATPSSIIFQSTVAGSSGSTAQTLLNTLVVTNRTIELLYDDTYKTTLSTSSAGNLTITPSGGSLAIAADLNMGANTVHFGTSEQTQTPTGTTATISLHTGNHHTLDCSSASGDVTLTLTVPPGPCSGTLVIKQGATARDITWTPSAGTVKWLGTEPTWGSDTSKYRLVAWRWDGSLLFLSATDTD